MPLSILLFTSFWGYFTYFIMNCFIYSNNDVKFAKIKLNSKRKIKHTPGVTTVIKLPPHPRRRSKYSVTFGPSPVSQTFKIWRTVSFSVHYTRMPLTVISNLPLSWNVTFQIEFRRFDLELKFNTSIFGLPISQGEIGSRSWFYI